MHRVHVWNVWNNYSMRPVYPKSCHSLSRAGYGVTVTQRATNYFYTPLDTLFVSVFSSLCVDLEVQDLMSEVKNCEMHFYSPVRMNTFDSFDPFVHELTKVIGNVGFGLKTRYCVNDSTEITSIFHILEGWA